MASHYLNQKNLEYKDSKLDLDAFTQSSQFDTAEKSISASIGLILHAGHGLHKRSAIEEAEIAFIKELEKLKEKIKLHPNYAKFKKEEQELKEKELFDKKSKEISSDIQFAEWCDKHIPNQDNIQDRDRFVTNIIKNIFTDNFNEKERTYGAYERNLVSKNIMFALDFMHTDMKCYIVVMKSAMGYLKQTLSLCKIPKIYTNGKDPISPSVILSVEYLDSKGLFSKVGKPEEKQVVIEKV